MTYDLDELERQVAEAEASKTATIPLWRHDLRALIADHRAALARIAELEGTLNTLIADVSALDDVRYRDSLPMPNEWGRLVTDVGITRLHEDRRRALRPQSEDGAE